MRYAGALLTLALALSACSAESGPDLSAEAGASAAPATSPAAGGRRAARRSRARRGSARPRTAKQAAAALVAAQQAIADPATAEKELVRAARSQQLAYRELGTRPRWDDAVLAGVPRSLRADVRANVASRREFRSMHTTLADTLPAWRIVDPAPAEELLRHYRAGEAAYGVGWEYLAAINLVETGDGPDPRHLGRRRAGPDAVHPLDLGAVGPRRHQRPRRRDHGRRPLPRPQRRRPPGPPRQRAVPLQQRRPLRPRRHPPRRR